MQVTTKMLVIAALAAMFCSSALAAGKNARPATVVYKDGKKVELKSFEIGIEDSGLFGSSYKKRKKLPIKTGKLRLDVPLEKLAKIEFVAAEKEGKVVKVRLTALDGKVLEGVLDSEKKIIWKGTHPFADSEVTLDPAVIKEIILGLEKK